MTATDDPGTNDGLPLPTLIQRLRDDTRNLHVAMEAALDWERRMSSRAGYERLLARWWGFHSVFEPMMMAATPLVDVDERRKLHLIEADLLHLGFLPEAIVDLPRIPTPGFLDENDAMIGALYVLEGSTLGGQVIARHVERHLGVGVAEGGCAYLQGYGKSRTMPMWRAFQEHLVALDRRDRHEGVVQGARRTFSALREWLPG